MCTLLDMLGRQEFNNRLEAQTPSFLYFSIFFRSFKVQITLRVFVLGSCQIRMKSSYNILKIKYYQLFNKIRFKNVDLCYCRVLKALFLVS